MWWIFFLLLDGASSGSTIRCSARIGFLPFLMLNSAMASFLSPVPEALEGPCKIIVKNGKEAIFYGLSRVPPLGSIRLRERLRRPSNPA